MQYLYRSPIGSLYLIANKKGLSGLYLEKQTNEPLTKNLTGIAGQILAQTIRELDEYFAGHRKKFTIPLAPEGTEFQKKVWRELAKIPFGKTVSYKDVASGIKKPTASRAVGSANGKNPICIIVPCHRVIASDGSLGGYSGGLKIKQYLLKLEQN